MNGSKCSWRPNAGPKGEAPTTCPRSALRRLSLKRQPRKRRLLRVKRVRHQQRAQKLARHRQQAPRRQRQQLPSPRQSPKPRAARSNTFPGGGPLMARAYVALGSNLGDRVATLYAALDALREMTGVQVVEHSSFHETKPVGGPPGQGDYLNAAAAIETSLDPTTLLNELLRIEQQLG